MNSTELNLSGRTASPDSRGGLIAQLKAIRWPNSEARQQAVSPEKREFTVSNGAIGFASKLRVMLDEQRVIGFAGTSKRVDVSEVSRQTALALARMEAGPVLLVDADVRRPRAHEMFHVPLTPGLADVMEGRAKMLQAVSPTGEPGLQVMAAGAPTAKPAQLFSSLSFRSCLAVARQEFRYVIVRIPSMDDFLEASLVAGSTQGLVLVAESGSDTRSRLSAIRSELASLRVSIIGALLSQS